MNPGQFEVVWVAPESEADELAEAAKRQGGTANRRGKWVPDDDLLADDGDRMEPLMAIGLIVATGWLITRISDALRDHLRPELQIVDMRRTPPIVLVARHIHPPGTLLVLKTVNGQDTEERYGPERRDEALAVLGGLFG